MNGNWYWHLIDIDFNNYILIDIYHNLPYLHLLRFFSFAHRIFTISAPFEAIDIFSDWNTILTSIFIISVTQELLFIYPTSVMSRIKPFHLAALRLSWKAARCRLSDLSSTAYLLTESIYNFYWIVYRDGLLSRGKAWIDARNSGGATITRITRFFSFLALTVLHYSPYNCLSDIITSITSFRNVLHCCECPVATRITIYLPWCVTPTYPSYTSEPGRCRNAYLPRNWYRWRASEVPTSKVYYDEHMCPAVIMWGWRMPNSQRDHKHVRGKLRLRFFLLLRIFMKIFAHVNFLNI